MRGPLQRPGPSKRSPARRPVERGVDHDTDMPRLQPPHPRRELGDHVDRGARQARILGVVGDRVDRGLAVGGLDLGAAVPREEEEDLVVLAHVARELVGQEARDP